MSIETTILGIDWKLLREQKNSLLGVISFLEYMQRSSQAEAMTGLLHFLDAIQDEAALALGEKTVFGSAH